MTDILKEFVDLFIFFFICMPIGGAIFVEFFLYLEDKY